jgi:hypothetical protein
VALSPLKNANHYAEAGAQVQKSVNLFGFAISRLTFHGRRHATSRKAQIQIKERNCC